MAERRARIARDEPLQDDAVIIAVVVKPHQRELLEGQGSRGFGRLRQRGKEGAAGTEEDEGKVLVGPNKGSLDRRGYERGWGVGGDGVVKNKAAQAEQSLCREKRQGR